MARHHSDPVLWRELLDNTKIWFGSESENAFACSFYSVVLRGTARKKGNVQFAL
jgi:hypothetical protein